MTPRSLRRHNQTFLRCRDAHGRSRDLAVAYDEHGNITLTMPPAETIVLDHRQAGHLRVLLENALSVATARGSRATARI